MFIEKELQMFAVPVIEQTLIILIPTAAVGLIIGKAGQFLKYIGHISGATLRLQVFDDMAPGTRERALFIGGDPRVIQSAMQIIMLRLQTQLTTSQAEQIHADKAEQGGKSSDKLVIQWIIPQNATGLLIGKNGTRIKMINERSGAWVKIAHPEEAAPGVGERYVYIRGTQAQSSAAVDIVRSIAGGRASNASDKLGNRSTIVIPLRSVASVVLGDASTGVPPLHGIFPGIFVKVEAPYLTGISSAKLIIDGPSEARHAVELIIKERLEMWSALNSFNTLHNLSDISGSEGFSAGSDEDNQMRVKVEMCAVILVASECADLLTAVDVNGKNVFADVKDKFGVSLELVAENALSAAYGSRTRVIALIGPLGSLLHALEPVQAIMFAHHPAPVLPPHQQPLHHTSSAPSERNRRNLSPEELHEIGEQNRHRALALALSGGDGREKEAGFRGSGRNAFASRGSNAASTYGHRVSRGGGGRSHTPMMSPEYAAYGIEAAQFGIPSIPSSSYSRNVQSYYPPNLTGMEGISGASYNQYEQHSTAAPRSHRNSAVSTISGGSQGSYNLDVPATVYPYGLGAVDQLPYNFASLQQELPAGHDSKPYIDPTSDEYDARAFDPYDYSRSIDDD